MKKKVSVKKVAKKAPVKKTTKKTNAAKVVMVRKPVIVDSKRRSFWSLFDKVKNHNFGRMMQRGNCLEDFIKFVEDMPDQMFQHLFLDPLDLTPIREQVYVGCECPTDTQCFCCRYKTVGTRNGYTDYLKMHEIQRYDVEIQHLRYLIKLQANGVAVPAERTIEEFFKRSAAPNQPTPVNTSHYTQSNFGVKETVVRDEPVKMTATSLDSTPEEVKAAMDKAESRAAQLKLIADAIKRTSNLDALMKIDTDKMGEKYGVKMATPEVQHKYLEKKRARTELIESVAKEDENKELDTSFLSAKFGEVVETRPRLSDLKDSKVTDVQKKLQEFFDKDKEATEALSTFRSEKSSAQSMKEALQTITKYARILEDSPTTTEAQLPQFWQDVKGARESFEKFNVFYARKYADYVDSLRDLNKKEQEYIASDKPSDKHALQNNVLRHLNAQRDLEVMKKILNSAYDHFRKAEITQAEASQLQEEMSKYTEEPAKQLEGLFDHLIPTGSYVVRNNRKVPFDIHNEDFSFMRRSESEREKEKQAPVVVEVKEPDLATKEGRADYRKRLAEKVVSDEKADGVLVQAPKTRAERIASEIQRAILKDRIDPSKDFPELIKNGLDEDAVELWKKQYQGYMVPVSADRRRRLERLELLQKSV